MRSTTTHFGVFAMWLVPGFDGISHILKTFWGWKKKSTAIQLTFYDPSTHLPAFNWEANDNIFLCFGSKSSVILARSRICGLQFFVWGGPSSSWSRAYLAADMANPRIPSPHSCSALEHNKTFLWKDQVQYTVNCEIFEALKVGEFAFFQLAVDKIPHLLQKLNG
jgi:hypothetical protein